jgi:hypothetical protein
MLSTRRTFFALLLPIALTASASFVQNAALGLEHSLFAVLSVALAIQLGRETRQNGAIVHSSWILALCFATRPESAVLGVGCMLLRFAQKRTAPSRRDDYTWLASTGLLLGVITLFRLAYFGSVLAPVGLLSSARWTPTTTSAAVVARELVSLAPASALVLIALLLVPARQRWTLSLLASWCLAILLAMWSTARPEDTRGWLECLLPITTLLAIEGLNHLYHLGSKRYLALRSTAASVAASVVMACIFAGLYNFYPYPSARGQSVSLTQQLPPAAREQLQAWPHTSVQTDSLLALHALSPWRIRWQLDGGLDEALGEDWVVRTQDTPTMQGFLALRSVGSAARVQLRREQLVQALPELRDDPRIPATSVVAAIDVSEAQCDPGTEVLLTVLLRPALLPGAGQLVLANSQGQTTPVRFEMLNALRGGEVDFSASFAPSPLERVVLRRSLRLAQAGHYRLQWQSEGTAAAAGDVAQATILVGQGVGLQSARRLTQRLQFAMDHGDDSTALSVARQLSLIGPQSAAHTHATLAVRLYAKSLIDRARMMTDVGALEIGSALAREVLSLTHEPALTSPIAERLLDAARIAQPLDAARASVLATATLALDPRRSWARPYLVTPDPRSHSVAEQTLVSLLEAGVSEQSLDHAVALLARERLWSLAARLADRFDWVPRSSRARVTVARGMLSMGRVRDALRLVSGVPCSEAHDRELTVALRAVLEERDNGYRPNDSACLAP